MSKAKLIGRTILAVLGAVLIWLSVRALMGVPVYKEAIGSAVYLEEPVVLPENEGRMVVIHGTPEMTKPACDEELGLTLNTIKAYRYDEEYKLISTEDQYNKYEWVSRGGKTIVGEAKLGEFNLDEKTLTGFPADKDYEDYDAREISENGYGVSYGRSAGGAKTDRLWVVAGGKYYYAGDGYSRSLDIPYIMRSMQRDTMREREGAKAYAYKVYAGNDAMTIAGIQRGNTLAAHEKLGAVVGNGVLTQEELARSQAGALVGGSVAFLLIGLLLIFLALRKGKKKKLSNKKKYNQKAKAGNERRVHS